MAQHNLPTYVVPADECSPDDDRRHGCGICHRRFNRPSSLRIHMNSHTGDQPYECPYPGCRRRFSVNSNMRRHYRNHRDANTQTPPTIYAPLGYPDHVPRMSYSMHASPGSSTLSSFSDSEDRVGTPVIASPNTGPYQLPQGRTRSASQVFPPTQVRPTTRPRSCTVPGCDCDEAPRALRPAFQPAHPSRLPPPHSR
ncbi:hypothetical protein C8Q77DRAFT_1047187 [Trametes polyzona]|nr:hypothetical protein C8Q77DRAFT_1047187 [Trametes polyzona]